MNPCPYCNESIDDWNWIRFAGLGPWKDNNEYYGCPHCNLRFDGSKIPKVDYKPELMLAIHQPIDSREADGRELTKGLGSSDPLERKLASEALQKIRNESPKVKDMRKALIKAHRNQDKKQVKEIHEDIKNRPDYK